MGSKKWSEEDNMVQNKSESTHGRMARSTGNGSK